MARGGGGVGVGWGKTGISICGAPAPCRRRCQRGHCGGAGACASAGIVVALWAPTLSILLLRAVLDSPHPSRKTISFCMA